MKKGMIFVLAICFTLGIAGASFAAVERATAKEAEAMVKKAVAFLKANGKEKAIPEFNNNKGHVCP